jgi:hypothetical protein
MSASYYVQVPGTNFPTAEVEAASTKHARTAYLDYLSRNNLIDWNERQAWRSKTLAKRMQPGEFKTQVVLDYDAGTIPEVEVSSPPTEREIAEEEEYYGEIPLETEPVVVEPVQSRTPMVAPSTATPAPGTQPLTQPKANTNKLSVLGKVPSVLPKSKTFTPPKAMQISQKTGGV